MKYHEELCCLGCFTREDARALTGNQNTAGSFLKNYQKKGYIRQIRRNLHVPIDLADDRPIASGFTIAGRITPTSRVSHRAAFEFYDMTKPKSRKVEVCSETPFNTFEFDGDTCVRFAPRIREGLDANLYGIRVTDRERTILDGIRDFEKTMGLPELFRCLTRFVAVNTKTLLVCLAAYGKQVMYQKTGYIPRHFRRKMYLKDDFFHECASRVGKSTRYLTRDGEGIFNPEWRPVAPPDLMKIADMGGEENVGA